MATIETVFLNDDEEAELNFRKAHGADVCPACDGQYGKWHDHFLYASERRGYSIWEPCASCDGLGSEPVKVYTLFDLSRFSMSFPIIRTRGEDWWIMHMGFTEIDQPVLMEILQQFAPQAYAAYAKPQGVQ